MKPQTVHSIFFSPTKTSRTITRAVSRGMDRGATSEIDLTREAPKPATFSQKDMVVVGMPVYGGRLPKIAVERFRSLKGSGTPLAALVVYGNRAYEDALAELCDLGMEQGFKVFSAAAFVGQHSFSSEEKPIAHNRPDQKDLDSAEYFGTQIKNLIGKNALLDLETIPGNRPFKPIMKPSKAATASNPETCIQCGACESCCPTQCIEMVDGMPQTRQDECIWCMACVQACPTGARKIVLPKIYESIERLHANCQIRKDPETFLPLEK